jgi:predicted peptidase
MTISDHILNDSADAGKSVFGTVFCYRYYETNSPYLVLFGHGKGEIGPADGSALGKVEVNGWPRAAAGGFEFPFNILAYQYQNAFQLQKVLPAWAKMKYGKRVIATGLSQGGITTYGMAYYDDLLVLDAIAPVCGMQNIATARSMRDIQGQAWHGDRDVTVPFHSDESFCREYNTSHTVGHIEFRPVAGVGHNVWDIAYDTRPGKDDLLQWVVKQFQSQPNPMRDSELLSRIRALVNG